MSSLAWPPLLDLEFIQMLDILQENQICASVSGAVFDLPADEGKEVWDYVTVRKDAHMFWWLYYATNPCKNFSELPLVMWLQVKVASLLCLV